MFWILSFPFRDGASGGYGQGLKKKGAKHSHR